MRIVITGFVGEGKTTLARVIQSALLEMGFDAQIIDDADDGRPWGRLEYVAHVEAALAKIDTIEILTQAIIEPLRDSGES